MLIPAATTFVRQSQAFFCCAGIVWHADVWMFLSTVWTHRSKWFSLEVKMASTVFGSTWCFCRVFDRLLAKLAILPSECVRQRMEIARLAFYRATLEVLLIKFDFICYPNCVLYDGIIVPFPLFYYTDRNLGSLNKRMIVNFWKHSNLESFQTENEFYEMICSLSDFITQTVTRRHSVYSEYGNRCNSFRRCWNVKHK